MNAGRTIFSQLMEHLPHKEFQRCVERYGGDARPLGFSCWDQYLAMAFAQLTYRESLRHRGVSWSRLRQAVPHGFSRVRDALQAQRRRGLKARHNSGTNFRCRTPLIRQPIEFHVPLGPLLDAGYRQLRATRAKDGALAGFGGLATTSFNVGLTGTAVYTYSPLVAAVRRSSKRVAACWALGFMVERSPLGRWGQGQVWSVLAGRALARGDRK